ncbi:MAG TPA: nitrogen fixation protein NifH [Patescibacteria group bacterium]|nr:nitrogen fixation protein NifH [Patescibacteria group bacterium]
MDPMAEWIDGLRHDPRPWLLDDATPAVRHLALRQLCDRAPDDPDVRAARAAAMAAQPIADILAAQDPAGWWGRPGSGYGPKYASTVWTTVFLDQLGADGDDPRIRTACAYLLDHTQTASGGFGAAASGEARPAPSTAIHCLNGNVLRALIGFGWLDDERVGRSIDWQAAAITGEGDIRFYRSSMPGPGFCCGANEGLPCAWGATKAVLALSRIPPERRAPHVRRAIDAGVAFLLSRDPATADYPMGYGNRKPNGSWFKLGFPSGYVTDVLQVLEALCEAGAAGDPRLGPAIDWLLAQQDDRGRWVNRYAYAGKMAVDIDVPGQPSRWVTLRACRVLKAVAESGATLVGSGARP